MTQWHIKYKPTTENGYVFTVPLLENDYKAWKQDNDIPNTILYGPPGTGKTSFAKMLVTEFGVGSGYLTHWNGGLKNSVKDVRALEIKLKTGLAFSTDYPKHFVIWDEVNRLSEDAIHALKGIIDETEEYTTFIFTTNDFAKLQYTDPALINRCNCYKIDAANDNDLANYCAKILMLENKTLIPPATIPSLVKGSGGSFRKLLRNLKANAR